MSLRTESSPTRPTSLVRAAAAVAAGLALADASIVVIALPPIIAEFGASVSGGAAVIGAYTLALAVALAPLAWGYRSLDRATSGRGVPALGAAGALGFAAASAGCGLAASLPVLVALRAVQGAAAAATLVAAFAVMDGGRDPAGRRAWSATAVVGAALGPAVGGALTQLLDWRAIFWLQAPLIAVAGLAILRGRTPQHAPVERVPADRREGIVGALALGLLSAALTGLLFLLVVLLISGWAMEPLTAAALVSGVPVAALLGTRLPGSDLHRATLGCVLVGVGVVSLAFVPGDTIAMILLPQVVAGLGMGMALPALAGGLLPERTPAQAIWLLAVRHVGITAALAALAPVTAAEIERAVDHVHQQGTAIVLDAGLPISDKLDLADVAVADLDAVSPRAELRSSLDAAAAGVDRENRPAHDDLSSAIDTALLAAVNGAFRPALWICGSLALLAALMLALSRPRIDPRMWLVCGAALLLVPLQAALFSTIRPPTVAIADPCEERALPQVEGVDSFLQRVALQALDAAACRFGSTREELALALVDEDRARLYERDHGVDPRSVGALRALL